MTTKSRAGIRQLQHHSNFHTLRHDQHSSTNHYHSTRNHQQKWTYHPNYSPRRWQWWRWGRRRRRRGWRRRSSRSTTRTHREIRRQPTKRIPQRPRGKQGFPTQLPPLPRNEPTRGTACHPLPKKYDIPVIHPRTPRKRLGRRTSTVAHRSSHWRSTTRPRKSMGHNRNTIPPSIYRYRGKAKSPTEHKGAQDDGRRFGHIHIPIPINRKEGRIPSQRRSNSRCIPKSATLQVGRQLYTVRPPSKMERLDKSCLSPSTRVHLPQREGQRRGTKRRSHKIPVEERA